MAELWKEYIIRSSTKGEIESARNSPELAVHGFTSEDYEEMVSLLRQKQDYLLSSLHDNDSWEWNAKMHLIVTGTKE